MLPSKEIIVYDLPGSWSLLSRNRETEFYMKIPFRVLFFETGGTAYHSILNFTQFPEIEEYIQE